MKKYYFFLAALFTASLMSAQSTDTVKVIDQPSQVIITESPTGVQMKVVGSKNDKDQNYIYTVQHSPNDTIHTSQGSDWELNFPYSLNFSKVNVHHWTLETKGIYFGGGLGTSCDLVKNSFNWGILNIVSINYNTLHGQEFSLGVGYDSKRFSLKGPNCFVMNEATKVVDTDIYPEGTTNRSSIFNVRAIQFPLTFQQNLGRHFHFVLGGSMNWNVYAKCKTKYTENKVKTAFTYKDLKQKKITFDVIGGLSYHGLAVYCRYTPGNLFKDGYGPEIKNTWTLGGAIAF